MSVEGKRVEGTREKARTNGRQAATAKTHLWNLGRLGVLTSKMSKLTDLWPRLQLYNQRPWGLEMACYDERPGDSRSKHFQPPGFSGPEEITRTCRVQYLVLTGSAGRDRQRGAQRPKNKSQASARHSESMCFLVARKDMGTIGTP